MSAPRKPELDAAQAYTVRRAREALEAAEAERDMNAANLARHLGSLEWYTAELLVLVGELTGGAA